MEEIRDIIERMSDFHFLRPQLLWLGVPLLLVLLLLIRKSKSAVRWKREIAEHLQPYVITGGVSRGRGIYVSYIFIVIFTTLAVAGPTWEREDVPGLVSESQLYIALDASRSMLAEDIAPSRLDRARFKVADLIEADPGVKIGVIAYAGTSHLLLPPCSDYRLISHQLEAISPNVMPLSGSNLERLSDMVDTLIVKRAAPTTLLLLTDVITSSDADRLTTLAANPLLNIELFLFSTVAGAPVPNGARGYVKRDGENIISALDPAVLFTLQESAGVSVNTLTLDSSDMDLLAEKLRNSREFQESDGKSNLLWRDMGYYLIPFIVFMFLFWFRRGWVLNPESMGILLLLLTSCGNVDNIWSSKDYQADKLYNQGEYGMAAELYESPLHKGAAYFKDGNYDAAAYAFAQDSSDAGEYNRALACAKMGMYIESKEILSSLPEQSDNIKELLKSLDYSITITDSLNSLFDINNPPVKEESKKKGELNERKAKGQDEELTSDTEAEKLPEEGDRITDEVDSGIRKGKELDEVPPEGVQVQELMGAKEILLQEISDSPSLFLERRFRRQYKRRYGDDLPKRGSEV